MSRYGVDKVLRQLVKDEDDRNLYQANRAAMLDKFSLTAEEYDAFLTIDLKTLYRLGAHSFILWGAFARLARDQEEFRTEYLAAISDLGYPDFET